MWLVEVKSRMVQSSAGRTHGEIQIAARPALVMRVISDLARYPEWSEGVTGATVLSSTPDGRPKTAALTFAAGPIADSFELEYAWSGDRQVDWHIVTPGDVLRRQDGTYRLDPQSNGSVLVAYDLEVELTVPIIGKLRSRAERMIIRAALDGLKRQVSRVAQEEGTANV